VLFQTFTGRAQPVIKVAAGDTHSLFLKSDGSLWGMGLNSSGQLGDGTTDNGNYYTNLPEMIVASNVTAIAAENEHSLFLKSDGSLWSMGGNQYGQLGDGTTNNVNLPEMIVASNVTAIAGGRYFSLFLKSDGSLWAMGANFDGEFGNGTNGDFPNVPDATNLPEQIVSSNVTAIAAGWYHTLFIKSDGSLWGMGYDLDGELGVGIFNETNRPVQIVASNVKAVAAGVIFSLFLESDGSLWAMGNNGNGQLGDGTRNPTSSPEQVVSNSVTAIVAGEYFSLFLKSDGSLWGMGDGGYGQLGDGATNGGNILSPQQIVAGVTAMAGGGYHSLFVKSDGSLWAMGWNKYGQLGDGAYGNPPFSGVYIPEQIVAGPPGYNRISAQLLTGGNVSLSYMGLAGTNYVLDQSFTLSPANWVPRLTNSAGVGGVLVFTNTPNPTTNNFWRVRSVP